MNTVLILWFISVINGQPGAERLGDIHSIQLVRGGLPYCEQVLEDIRTKSKTIDGVCELN